jgi:hypothetical protein
MTQIVTVYPVPGRLIMMPDQGFKRVPDEGVDVIKDAFYTTAINQGDLTLTAPAVKPVASAPAVAPSAPVTPSTAK